VLVITLRGGRVAGLTRFESPTMRAFGLPRILRDDTAWRAPGVMDVPEGSAE